MITRFAPTPSGFLHEGNAVNALLVSWLARSISADVALRIDDLDAARLRPEYVADIFDTLAWLDVRWTVGPRDPTELSQRAADPDRVLRYRRALDAARESGLEVYACRCSRRMLAGPAVGGCPGGCRHQDLPHEPGTTVRRVHIEPGTLVTVDGVSVDVSATAGDVVLWRRDDLPAYHLASIVDDRDLGITHVVRGIDLRESTALQCLLAPALDAASVARATYLHHDLVMGSDGGKLSKSQLGRGSPMARTTAERTHIEALADQLGAGVGITRP